MKRVFEHAWILTMDEQFTQIRNGWLLVNGKNIEAMGEGLYPGECDERIDARGGILLPGFINTHCHASMIPFRTMGDDCPDRLRRFLFPLEDKAMTKELVYLGALYGIAEMLLAGVTTFVDMYYFEDEVVRACQKMGMRGYLGETIIGQSTCDSRGKPYGGFEIAREILQQYYNDDLIHPILAPHGTTTCDEAALRRSHDMAVQYGTLMTLHVSEMDYEMKHFAEMGHTPLSYMDSIGAVSEHLLAAHCIHVSPEDAQILSKRGASVAHCIASNTKAGKGVAPVKALLEANVPVGLGTDGPSSGNTLNLFDQMRLFANFHKNENRDRSLFPARDIVALATRGGAKALHAEREIGMLKPGMRADMVLVSIEGANMFPTYNPYSALVYCANTSNVDVVMAGGEIRVRGGRLTRTDLPGLRARLAMEMKPFMESAAEYADII